MTYREARDARGIGGDAYGEQGRVSLPSNKDIPRRTRAWSPHSVAIPTHQSSLAPTNSSEYLLGPPLTGYMVSPRGSSWFNLRLRHYSCSFKTLIKPQAGLGPVLTPTFPPLLSWRSPFPCTSAGWKGATSHLPSPSRGSVTNEDSLALSFHALWPVLLQEETFQGSDWPLSSLPRAGFSLCNRLREEFLQEAQPA